MNTIDNIMAIVDGIDEYESDGGWWETSAGVQFGRGVKQALRAAIEQALTPGEPVAYLWQHSETGRTRIVMPDQITTTDATWHLVGPLYLAPQTQSEQEPFGWYDTEHGEVVDVEFHRDKPRYEGNWKPLYTAPQPQPKQEPVIIHREIVRIEPDGTETWRETPLYTAPQPQREWLEALREADRLMTHDDEPTEWRERWAHLFYGEQAPQPQQGPVDERALIRKVDAELEAHGLESYTTVHTSRYRLLTAARHFLSVATGRLPDWLLQPAQALRAATEEGITK